MRKLLLASLGWVSANAALAQVVDVYPFIQRPTETSATIAWRRANGGTATLRYGTDVANLSNSLSISTATQKPYFDLSGLQPATKYYYQCQTFAPSDTFTSAVEYFYTADPKSQQQIDFLVYGDCGYNNTIQNDIAALMEQEDADFGVVVGDVDQGVGDDYEGVFLGVYKDMLKHECHFTCIGNHDTYADAADTYLDIFYLPTNNPQQSERYYSFVWGDAKFIILDPNIAYNIGSAQHNWLLDELRCNEHKWLFVCFHQPPWSNCWSPDYYLPFSPYFLYQGNADMRTDLVPYFEQYKVDFVLNGHSHCYQRGSYNGIKYLITGGAGSSLIDSHTNSNSPNIDTEIFENHYTIFEVNNNTAGWRMINRTGVQRDSVFVTKSYTPYAASLTKTDISCFGANNGSATINVQGPKPPYTLQWDNGQTTATATGLTPGLHDVVITDGVGCQRIETIEILEPTAVDAQVTSNTGANVLCPGATLTLTASSSNATSYLWSNASTNASITVFVSGSYSVTAYDANGCASTPVVVPVTMDVAPVANFTHQANGMTIDFSGSTNAANADYTWIFGDGAVDISNTTNVSHTYATGGTYTVQLIVENACGADTVTQTITVGNVGITPLQPTITAVSVQPNPFKQQTTFTIEAAMPVLDYSFFLFDADGREVYRRLNLSGNTFTLSRNELPAGVYLYRVEQGGKSWSGKLVVE